MEKSNNTSPNDVDKSINGLAKANNGKIKKILPDNNGMMYPFLFTYEETEYLVEEGTEKEFSFSFLEIYTKRTNLELTAFKKRIYNRKPLYEGFRITIKDVERLKKNTEGMSISLYKKGVSKPLMQETVMEEKKQLSINWTYKIKELEPGGYFLWLRGGNTLLDTSLGWKIGEDEKIDFEILEDGEELEHPEIAQFTLEKESEPILSNINFKHKNLLFDVILTEPLADGNIISACCYNEDLYQMTKEVVDGYPTSKSVYKILVDIEDIWMPGTYDLILLHNQAPFARLPFSINNDEVYLGNIVPVERYDKYYMIGRYLNIDEENWDRLSHEPLSAGLRKGIVDNMDAIGFNKICLPYFLFHIYENMNYLIECTDDDENLEMIEIFCSLIANARTEESYDCKECVDKCNKDKASVDDIFVIEDGANLVLLKNAGNLLQNGGEHLMSRIITGLRSRKNNFVFVCNKGEGDRLFEAYPIIKPYIPDSHRISMIDYSTSAIAFEIINMAQRDGMNISMDARCKVADILVEAEKKGMLAGWNKEYMKNYVYDTLLANYRKRKLAEKLNEKETISGYIEVEDIDSAVFINYKESFEEAMAGLNAMIGLGKVKQNFEAVMYTLRMFQLRKNVGLSSTFDMSHHMLFTGNPGTGKTTVAKMIGKIFKSLGLLSKGDVIVADRSRMVGQWIGETERKMRELLIQAQGNVLFIDEAYSLCNGSGIDRRDYGYRVIECLMPVLALDNPDMLVIMAGYPKEMDILMERNAGLKGRFAYRFNFDDYTAEELIKIGKNLLEKNDYQMSTEAEQLFCSIVDDTVKAKDRNFSNARWVEQFIRNRIIPAMAERIVHQPKGTDKDYYCMIQLADVEAARLIEKDKEASLSGRAPIGFTR